MLNKCLHVLKASAVDQHMMYIPFQSTSVSRLQCIYLCRLN